MDPNAFAQKVLSLSKHGKISREIIHTHFPEIPEAIWKKWLQPMLEEGLIVLEK
jgi:hypothetical protein